MADCLHSKAKTWTRWQWTQFEVCI